jgi:hypothetical protein
MRIMACALTRGLRATGDSALLKRLAGDGALAGDLLGLELAADLIRYRAHDACFLSGDTHHQQKIVT